GMRQRVMIAMALSLAPKLIIADEPTTALDATVQAQILDLLLRLQRDSGTALILITHDLGVVADIADDVMVMYAGKAAETASKHDIFYRPHHPYTKGLLESIPRSSAARNRLRPITGQPPSLIRLPTGCSFHPRNLGAFGQPGARSRPDGHISCRTRWPEPFARRREQRPALDDDAGLPAGAAVLAVSGRLRHRAMHPDPIAHIDSRHSAPGHVEIAQGIPDENAGVVGHQSRP
ncbi:MAG TPA: oligopeptide/dipeptide ABC transporter ATP-binding protein, partial [Streptosporangiaceae bacterium]